MTEHVPEVVAVDSSLGHHWEEEYKAVRSDVRGD